MNRTLLAALGVVLLGTTACSSTPDPSTSTPAGPPRSDDGIVAQVASYELVAGRSQRFIVGMFSNDAGMISFGSPTFTFRFLGSESAPVDEPRGELTSTAEFLPIPGSPSIDEPSTRFTSPSEARGVYGVDAIEFDQPGFWEVSVDLEIDDRRRSASAAFEVQERGHVPDIGDAAPRTSNLLPGDDDAPPQAIDSRSDDDGVVPDLELHEETIAAALDAGRPVMIVVSTPVYCVSRFCGPITDTVHSLAKEHGGAMDFVHIEVWRDFQDSAINRAAAGWIWPDQQGDPAEPWVFLVDANGIIVERWDNVATERDLADAVDRVLEEQT